MKLHRGVFLFLAGFGTKKRKGATLFVRLKKIHSFDETNQPFLAKKMLDRELKEAKEELSFYSDGEKVSTN